jgi:hypothetical protein
MVDGMTRPTLRFTLVLVFCALTCAAAGAASAQSAAPVRDTQRIYTLVGDPHLGDQWALEQERAARGAANAREAASEIPAVLFSMFVMGAIATFLIKRRAGSFESLRREAIFTANLQAVTTGLRGPRDVDSLGARLSTALRFGNFPEYVWMFPTREEAQRLFPPDRAAEYLAGPRDERTLRRQFETLRKSMVAEQLRVEGVTVSHTVARRDSVGGRVKMGAAHLRCVSPDGHFTDLPLGSVVELESGWKLMTPAT